MVRMSGSERNELWDRWEAGESQRSIARALDRSPATIRTRLLSSGWRRPIPGVEWCSLRLSLDEREETSRGVAQGESLRSIAERLGRSSSTVSRKSGSMVAGASIEQWRRIGCLGSGRNVQR
jgi:IS30 family transposase